MWIRKGGVECGSGRAECGGGGWWAAGRQGVRIAGGPNRRRGLPGGIKGIHVRCGGGGWWPWWAVGRQGVRIAGDYIQAEDLQTNYIDIGPVRRPGPARPGPVRPSIGRLA